ncbi:hypothetical protein GCM10027445_03230 [Amycolatopsis endophytica]|uniref:Ig-like domain-containing protein n=1 Tax=Amycolatopsis endophytica TaxID=860233 RepID=A0A853B7Q3_9PSEU|nr:hypothetical protein [Amycolatopsis endophytica]NYI91338.1 hypothetical protein [Amycolatopsis endophytica]
MTTTRLPRRATGHRRGVRALAATVLTSALGALALVTAAPASATPDDCTRWTSGSRGQTINVVCTAGTGHYGIAAACWDGSSATSKVVGIGETASAICYNSSVRSSILHFFA